MQIRHATSNGPRRRRALLALRAPLLWLGPISRDVARTHRHTQSPALPSRSFWGSHPITSVLSPRFLGFCPKYLWEEIKEGGKREKKHREHLQIQSDQKMAITQFCVWR